MYNISNAATLYNFLFLMIFVWRISNNLVMKLPLVVFNQDIMRTAIISKDNIKIYVAGLIVKIQRHLSLPKWVRETIYTYRFGKK